MNFEKFEGIKTEPPSLLESLARDVQLKPDDLEWLDRPMVFTIAEEKTGEALAEVRARIEPLGGLQEIMDAIADEGQDYDEVNHNSQGSNLKHNEPLGYEQLDQPIVYTLTREAREMLPEMSSETRDRLELQGYPEEILDVIGSEAEAKIYEDANLEASEVNGRPALTRTDIDYDQKDAMGNTNLERMKEGRAPLDANGKPIELHHIGQKDDSPLAELTGSEHRGNGNDTILHDKQKESEINREGFDKERQEYWKARAEQVESQR